MPKTIGSKVWVSLGFSLLALILGGKCSFAQVDETASGGANVTILHRFKDTDGERPSARLVQATDGAFYGVNSGGEGCPSTPISCGTVFKISPLGIFTTLYTFCSQPGCSDGATPKGALIQASDGNFYGTTSSSGVNNGGTVFKMTPDGTLTTLYSFCSQQPGCKDGSAPAGLIQADDGTIYGTATEGGAGNNGTIFSFAPSGVLTTLHSFCLETLCADGAAPSPLVQGTDGNFYGTTALGGESHATCPLPLTGCGTAYKMSSAGDFATLYSFCSQPGCPDGVLPSGPLVQASDGTFYGETYAGGGCPSYNSSNGCGTIFELSPGGAFATVYDYCAQAGCEDGVEPLGGLVLTPSGNLYGATYIGGPNADIGGTVFEFGTGTVATVYSFCASSCRSGFYANSLVLGTNGVLYGTAAYSTSGLGTIFGLSTGQSPFVEARPAMGTPGEVVTILGYGLKGATSVTFNGTPAKILLDRPSALSVEIPKGATSGQVQVVTPNGTLTSNVAFVVTL